MGRHSERTEKLFLREQQSTSVNTGEVGQLAMRISPKTFLISPGYYQGFDALHSQGKLLDSLHQGMLPKRSEKARRTSL